MPPALSLLRWLAVLALLLPGVAAAQEMREQATPFSVWLDLHALASRNPPRVSLPIWLNSVTRSLLPEAPGQPAKTTFRLRFRKLGDLNPEILVRVFFEDEKGASPTVSGWSETGAARFLHGPFGIGLELPMSETLTVPMAGIDYVDIEAPGDGANLRGLYLATLRKYDARHALDFAPGSDFADPFDNTPSSTLHAEDQFLYGRVRATIDPGLMKLTLEETPSGTWEFELGEAPAFAVVTFDILNADALAAPEITVNGTDLGPVSIQLPDLADPAFTGSVRLGDVDERFRYGGWLRCQKAIPGSALQAGLNKITIGLSKESGPVAVRAVELQLKSH